MDRPTRAVSGLHIDNIALYEKRANRLYYIRKLCLVVVHALAGVAWRGFVVWGSLHFCLAQGSPKESLITGI